ncbi:ATP-grasp peptide maturase system methyltransferase [Actinophytocola sp.]|uniref:ATP-grasp peptide maturase system methyltransferase n=1 Tax=Actinophytocola sp. TaxID=1872138 RepID=UPI002D7FB853|nr:ATP-grasp peptide maturase system methyltransferase [Actinophytocola sp.]HET9141912.1 ATP-grasp peptide maturase system methyltransferase [Actinophytocola sp.]HEU5108096.1 ATP-grasp peptide maturase system methyltransferase [Micromonosporaceae bacterium]
MATKGDVEGAARRHRGRLVRALERDRLLADHRWRAAFTEVPRHEFLPRFFRPVSPTGWAAIDSSDDDWLAQVYANRVLVTQLDDDPRRWELARARGEIRGMPTSSSSMPAIMAVMLEALDVADDHRVLEIGTGTGYNAALLCHRLRAGRLVTVDIDGRLVEVARRRLAALGYHPTCVATDGAAGYPPDAPYDRVVCTCAVSTVPWPWLAQTRPGGVVVTTLNRPLGAGLVRITVGAGGGQGRVLADDGRFMPLRAHRRHVDSDRLARLADAPGATRGTELAASMVTNPSSPFEFFAGLHLPGVLPASTGPTVLLVHSDGSWVRHRRSDDGYQVTQGGPRRLWDEAEKAYAQWCELGRPRRSRFGITVDPDTQDLWLDTPDSPYRWSLTAGR